MSTDTEIVKGFDNLARKHVHPTSIVCTIAEAVNTTEWTCRCTPIDGTPDILDVRLMATAANGFLIVPTVGSIVTVTMINDSNGYVSMFSEIASIQLNGDTYDGLVKINDLVTKLNNLEGKVNDLITAMNGHTHAGVTVGGGVTAVGSIPIVGSLTPTVKANLENTTVTHGNGT